MTTAANQFLDYEAAAALFQAAGFKCGAANARRLIKANPQLCRIDRLNYHTPRVARREVLALVKFLRSQKPRKGNGK